MDKFVIRDQKLPESSVGCSSNFVEPHTERKDMKFCKNFNNILGKRPLTEDSFAKNVISDPALMKSINDYYPHILYKR